MSLNDGRIPEMLNDDVEKLGEHGAQNASVHMKPKMPITTALLEEHMEQLNIQCNLIYETLMAKVNQKHLPTEEKSDSETKN
jgi:hypothetical protein